MKRQKLHSWPSQNSSGKGSSKSSLVEIVPRLRPATRFFLEWATTGTRRATGVPCSVIITSLPAKASASKSGNLVCASATLTVWVINKSSQRQESIALSKGLSPSLPNPASVTADDKRTYRGIQEEIHPSPVVQLNRAVAHRNVRWSRGRSSAYRRGAGTWRVGKLLPGAFSPCGYVPQ